MPNPAGPQTITDNARDRLQGFLLDELDRGVRRGFEISTDYPGFLASTSPAPPVYRTAKALTRQACRAWARGQTPVRGPAADAVYGPLCEPYLESIGEMPGDGSLNPPEFQGGQCPGVSYVVTYRVRNPPNQSGPFGTPISLNVVGPVSIGKASGTEPSCPSTGLVFPQNAAIFNGSGQNVRTLALGCTSEPVAYEIISVVRGDGLPDTCGSLPPTYTPPETPTGLPPVPPVTVDIPGVGPVDVDVKFNPDGTVTVSLPDLGIEVTKGDPADTRPSDKLPPGDQGDPGSPGNTGAGGDSEGEAPDGFVLVGLRLNLLAVPSEASQFATGVYRGACYIYMGGVDGLDQDFAGAFISDGQFVFAERDNLTRWRVSANNGYNIRVTPYYRRAEA